MVKIRVDNKEIEKSNELVKFSDPENSHTVAQIKIVSVQKNIIFFKFTILTKFKNTTLVNIFINYCHNKIIKYKIVDNFFYMKFD